MFRDCFRIANVKIGGNYEKRAESGRDSIAIEEERDINQGKTVCCPARNVCGSHLLQMASGIWRSGRISGQGTEAFSSFHNIRNPKTITKHKLDKL